MQARNCRSAARLISRIVIYLRLQIPTLPAVIRCANKIGKAVIKTTNIAVTFVIGRLRGLSIWLKIQMGKVCWLPAVKVVTMTSSKKAKRPGLPLPAKRCSCWETRYSKMFGMNWRPDPWRLRSWNCSNVGNVPAHCCRQRPRKKWHDQ